MSTGNTDAVAVIGIGCRFPPDNVGPEAYWRFLMSAGDAVGEVPPDRWRWPAFYDPDPAKPGRMPVRRMAYLTQPIEELDAAFFGIAPREAGQLDPQQRLLLEVSWEALEDARLDPWSLRGSATGVFVGAFTADNMLQRMEPGAVEDMGPQTALTCTQTVLASRLSYTYDLRGPSLVVDTACSSSLVAIHQAVRALLADECQLAMAGGVNRIFRPELSLMMAKGRFLAPDGRSKSFSASADGYGRGEGCGVVVLKRLRAAVADGDHIYAVVRGTGVNQDGRTGGPASPSSAAQAELVERVSRQAGVDPGGVAFVEAHGTGTPVGDPAEMQALGQVLGRAPTRRVPCVVGSVKAGLGHLEGAAGVAGFIKAALVACHGVVPPQAWLDELNPAIDVGELGLLVPTEAVPLEPRGRDLHVAVNSFGYGGTNAHAILTGPPGGTKAEGSRARRAGEGRAASFFEEVVLVSGHTDGAVESIATQYAALLDDATGAPARGRDLRAAFATRAHHEHRQAIVGAAGSFVERLEDVAAGRPHPDVIAGRVPGNVPVQPVFVFSGMGPQWWGMARGLLDGSATFRRHAVRCDEIFRSLAGWSLLDELAAGPEESRLQATEVAQPANVLVQTGLVQVLDEVGVRPAAVVGHSLGEVAAAHAAGCFELEDALAVAYHRSRLQASTAGTGTMLATELDEHAAAEVADRFPGKVSIAAINGARSTTLAGDHAALHQIAEDLRSRGVFCRELSVEVPYHSPAMDPILDELTASLAELRSKPAALPLYSTVSDELDRGPCDADYWAANVRRPVAFHSAVLRSVEDRHHLYLEVGPHPVLALYLRRTLTAARRANVVATLHRDHPDARSLTEAVAQLWAWGVPVAWRQVLGPGRPTTLPPYPWQRERHWQESAAVRKVRTGEPDGSEVLAGRIVHDTPRTNEVDLSPTVVPWCHEHVVTGEAVFPATGYLEAVVARARERAGGHLPVVVEDLQVTRPLILAEHQDARLRLVEGPDGEVQLLARRRGTADDWRGHATARIGRGRWTPPPGPPGVEAGQLTHRDVGGLYRQLAQLGLNYQGRFAALTAVATASDQVVAQAGYDDDIPAGYVMYPPLLDAALHAAFAVQTDRAPQLFVVSRIGRAVVHRDLPNGITAHIRFAGADGVGGVGGPASFDVSVWGSDGSCVAELHEVQLRPLPPEPSPSNVRLDGCAYHVAWEPGPATGRRQTVLQSWAVVDASGELARRLGQPAGAGMPKADLVAVDLPLAPADVERFDAVVVNVEPATPDDACQTAERVLGLVQQLARQARNDRQPELVLVTREACAVDPGDTGDGWLGGWVVGLRRAVANEVDSIRIRHVDHDGRDDASLLAVLVDSDVDEIALRAGVRHRARVERCPEARWDDAWWRDAARWPVSPGTNVALASTQTTLDGLCWVADRRVAPGPGQVELRVDAVGLNYKDVAKQLGLLAPAQLDGSFVGGHLGMEQSVVVERVGPGTQGYRVGQRFVASIPGGFRRYVTVTPDAVRIVPAPPGWDATQAAGQLVALATAHACLVEHGRVQPGEIVLVHGAAGGVGSAALRTALALGAVVFATAGTAEKRRLLRELGAAQVFDSRSLNFVDEVMAVTSGRGVDVVLNTLPGDGLRASLRVAAPGARVVEIGRREIVDGGTLPLGLLHKNLTLVSFDLDQIVNDRDRFDALAAAVVDGVEAGIHEPVPVTPFPAAQVRRGFELLARSGHTGKVVVDLARTEDLTCREAPGPAGPVRPDRWYLITGGTGALGVAAAGWLAARGARRLSLVSRRGVLDSAGAEHVATLRARGVEVDVEALDVTSAEDVESFLAERRQPECPLGGVIHCAGVSHDLPLGAMTGADLHEVLRPKLVGAAVLDAATRDDPLGLFVLVSSVSALTGTSGQSAYAGANSVLDSLAAHRRRQGRPAISLALGPVAEVGMAAADESIERYVRLLGFEHLEVEELPHILDRAVRWNLPTLAVFDLRWLDWSRAEPRAAASYRFAALVAQATSANDDAGSEVGHRIRTLPDEARVDALVDLVVTTLSVVLGGESDEPDADGHLANLGLDSLMLVELQTRLNHALGAELSLMGLLDAHTIRDVAHGLDRQLRASDEPDSA